MVEKKGSETLKDIIDQEETKVSKKDNLDEKLLDENGKPKNALYASIAAKKHNSVSQHDFLIPFSIITRTRRRTLLKKEPSILRATVKYTGENQS